MSDVITSELFEAARHLAIAGLVYVAYRTARDAASTSGRLPALRKSLTIVLAIAAFASVSHGSASCEESDPLYGGCEQRADDGFTPTSADRGGIFLYWLALLGIPAAMGIAAVKKTDVKRAA